MKNRKGNKIMKTLLAIAFTALTLWIFSDTEADAKDVQIVKVTIVDKKSLLKKCGQQCDHIKLTEFSFFLHYRCFQAKGVSTSYHTQA
jgi:hypothetical protein